MQIEIKFEAEQLEPKVIVVADKMTDEVNSIIKKLSETSPVVLVGYKDEKLEILENDDIIRIYAMDGKTIALTEKSEYVLKQRLYELEEKMQVDRFVRISNSEIVNLKKVKNFDLSLVGTICIVFKNGMKTYVSRRYVSKIKQVLGI